MLAVVKKHHTDSPLFEVKGEIPKDILNYLKDKYPEDIEITEGKDESVNLFDSDWFLNIGASITTGETVKIYRENNNLTQAQLGEKLGNFTRQNVSDIERGTRGISKDIARKLSAIFDVNIERFIA
ncbi:helix-turn-helix transcriptional regulator [Methyloprofundus sp.]|uniref:helix-turn-helix transcriptional regulator n=1 Tax=Methyloprofundus sp. TaxID=2020875 RepID=UPI003D0F2B3A